MAEPTTNCILCRRPGATKQREGMGGMYYFRCPTCGHFGVSDTIEAVIAGGGGAEYTRDAYIASGLTRELTETGADQPKFTTTNFKELISKYPVPDVTDVREKAKKLLERIRAKTEFLGHEVILEHETDYPLAYAKNSKEFEALLGLLETDGLIQTNHRLYGVTRSDTIVVTATGWSLVRSLHGPNPNSEQGFVAIWFDDTMEDSSDAIIGAVTDAGFRPMCIKDEHFKDKIMDKALGEIRNSRFIVVDLTGARNSVFFEAGFAFGLNIEAIYVYQVDKAAGLEFYVRHYQCHAYTDAADLREKVAAAIAARIKKS